MAGIEEKALLDIMGYLYLIANHDKKEVIHPVAKHRELQWNHFWHYVLIELLSTGFNKGRWAGDRIEIVGEETMAATSEDGLSDGTSLYEICGGYTDITKEMEADHRDDFEHSESVRRAP